jgi:2-keto-4-pentenoate hydratase/2-oxohepta-3-ene-1,7-dioic acid hydratase in catechol pathway
MRLASIRHDGTEVPALVDASRGVVRVADLVPGFAGDVLSILGEERWASLEKLAADAPDRVFADRASVEFGAPYRHPRMIWGIGLNYVDHAADLSEQVPEEPASFMKGDHTVIGPGEPIPVPPQSARTTAEGEIALVIGRHCRNVSEADALDHVAGVVAVLDQTAEDILERNPRFLTRSKNFPGFFSFGPEIVPLAELPDLGEIEVSTVLNGQEHRTNTVARMRYSPAFLVSFHSAVMPLQPGDLLSTGTPGALHIRPGDTVECRIPGVGVLSNPVVQG